MLIIGGSKGMGRATARLFFANGANIVATSRHPDCYEETPYPLVKLDVRDENEVKRVVDHVASHYFEGKIDILLNFASIHWAGPIADATGDDLVNIFQNNLAGYHRSVHYSLEYMRHSNSTRVISLGSVAAYAQVAFTGPYGFIKRALQHWNDFMQLEEMIKRSQDPNLNGPIFTLIEPWNVRTSMALYENFIPSPDGFDNVNVKAANILSAGDNLIELENSPDLNTTPEIVANNIYDIATSKQPTVRYIGGSPLDGVIVDLGFGPTPLYVPQIIQLMNVLEVTVATNLQFNFNQQRFAALNEVQAALSQILCNNQTSDNE